jgi:hypothetical protein
MPRLLGSSLVLVACHAAPAPSDDVDTDGAPTDSEVAAEDCTGTWSLALGAAPATLGRIPATWEDGRVAVRTEPYPSDLQAEVDGACLWLHPGLLRVDLHDTRCGATTVRARLTDDCGSTCTRLDAFVVDEPAGEDRNTITGAETELTLTTSKVFTALTVSTLDAHVCGVEVELAPLPPELVPEDTAALF